MRENVSLIFAVLIAVFILIVLPLLSIMSRQDSIAYNQVLTYTTKFVDDVRLKGYLTEEDYTRYLADIASTGNTYKVEMECRKKIYIPDSADTYVEDTLIYYNKYINSELDVENGGKGIIELKSNDEFYVKVYNTNITTASLLYNYFLRSNIPRKIVNIGYGGMVYSKSGKEFTETSFASTYAPEIKLAENETVKNTMGENCANTFYEDVGDKKIENTYYLFDLRQQKNQTLQVKFLLQNFEKIGNIEKGDNNWDNNSEGIKEAIKNNVALTGEVKANYNKEVKDIVIKDNGDITCTVKISNISLQEGVERTTSKIVIKEGLGEGSTGIVSVAGNSNEFILLYEKYDPAINITGPLKTESATSTTLSYEWDNKKAVVYFKVRGITGIDRKLENISNFKYTIIDVNNGQEVVSLQGTGTSQTKQGISIKVTTKEENNETVAYVQVNLEKVQDVNTYKLKVEGTYTENRGMGNEKTNNLTPKESYPFTVKDKEEYDPNITISGPYKSKNKESQTEFEYTETKSETVYFYVETTDIDTSTLKYMVVKGETQETNVVITTDGKWITIVAKEGVATDTNLKLRVSGTEKNKVEGQTSKRTITAESSTFKYVVPATFKLQGPYTNANFSTKQTNWTYSDTSDTITMYFKLNIENINININATSMVISNGTKEFTNENSFTADLDKKSGYYLITVTITSPYSLEGTNKLGITVNGTPIQSEEFIVEWYRTVKGPFTSSSCKSNELKTIWGYYKKSQTSYSQIKMYFQIVVSIGIEKLEFWDTELDKSVDGITFSKSYREVSFSSNGPRAYRYTITATINNPQNYVGKYKLKVVTSDNGGTYYSDKFEIKEAELKLSGPYLSLNDGNEISEFNLNEITGNLKLYFKIDAGDAIVTKVDSPFLYNNDSRRVQATDVNGDTNFSFSNITKNGVVLEIGSKNLYYGKNHITLNVDGVTLKSKDFYFKDSRKIEVKGPYVSGTIVKDYSVSNTFCNLYFNVFIDDVKDISDFRVDTDNVYYKIDEGEWKKTTYKLRPSYDVGITISLEQWFGDVRSQKQKVQFKYYINGVECITEPFTIVKK